MPPPVCGKPSLYLPSTHFLLWSCTGLPVTPDQSAFFTLFCTSFRAVCSLTYNMCCVYGCVDRQTYAGMNLSVYSPWALTLLSSLFMNWPSGVFPRGLSTMSGGGTSFYTIREGCGMLRRGLDKCHVAPDAMSCDVQCHLK